MAQLIAWLFLATIHALPALAFFRPSGLTALYGIAAGDAVFLLMQHRAALFLAVLITCVWAAFDPSARRLASIVVAVSMVSFLALYWGGGSPAALKRIALADLVGLPVLAFAAYLAFRQ